jgi:hypothetical protein
MFHGQKYTEYYNSMSQKVTLFKYRNSVDLKTSQDPNSDLDDSGSTDENLDVKQILGVSTVSKKKRSHTNDTLPVPAAKRHKPDAESSKTVCHVSKLWQNH